ncbi:MAG: hypothetical protein RLZZ612_1775 [Pseudomonadota bacterium]|jgi:hypothetical protein
MKHLTPVYAAALLALSASAAFAQAVTPAPAVAATDQVARDAAAAAQNTANQAQGNAGQAQASADRAQADATKALNGDANDRIARNLANAAQTTANQAQTTATAAQSTANAAQASATHAHQRIDDLDRKASRGIASALATTAAMPSGTDLEPGQTAMGIGFGSYSNYGAAAIGFARRIKTDEQSLVNGAVVRGAMAVSGGRPAVSVGMGWKW